MINFITKRSRKIQKSIGTLTRAKIAKRKISNYKKYRPTKFNISYTRLAWQAATFIWAVVLIFSLAPKLITSAIDSSAITSVDTVVAESNPTIIVHGSGFGSIPSSEIGVSTTTPYMRFTDTSGPLGTWHAGFTGDACSAIIGEWTDSEVIVRVNSPCEPYSVSGGDNIAINLMNSSNGLNSSFGMTAQAPQASAPSINSLTPSYGPDSGGTFAGGASGSATLSGSNLGSAQAVWFGNIATTNFTSTADSLSVTPPAYPSNSAVVVDVASLSGTSSQGCPAIALSQYCGYSYFYMSQNTPTTVPSIPINVNFATDLNLATLSELNSGVCANTSDKSKTFTAAGLDINGSATGGNAQLTYSYNTSQEPSDGHTAAYMAQGTVVFDHPITINIGIGADINGCYEIPLVPPLNDGLFGFYLLVGGNFNVNLSNSTITIQKGAYSVFGTSIPNQPLQLTENSSCVDANNNPLPQDECISAKAVAPSVVASVVASPIWFQVGPPDAFVGGGWTVGIQATYNGSAVDWDACTGLTVGAGTNAGPIQNGISDTIVGPLDFAGNDPSQCPLGTPTPAPNPNGPSITTTSLPAGTINEQYLANLSASGGINPLSWTASGLPNGLSISSGGQISGTPTQTGSFNPTFTVTDDNGSASSQSIALTINSLPPTSNPPTITTTSLPSATIGSSYSQTINATGGVTPYQWSETGSLPSGLSFNNNGSYASITGTPNSSAVGSVITVTVTGNDGESSSIGLRINVNAPPSSNPEITQFVYKAPYTTDNNQLVQFFITTANVPYCYIVGPAFMFGFSGTAPYRFNMNQCNFNNVALAFEPTEPMPPGTYPVTFVAQNSNGVVLAQQTANFKVVSYDTLGTDNLNLPDGYVGQHYSQFVTAHGGETPYTFTLSQGSSLPNGLNLNSQTGEISGTPTSITLHDDVTIQTTDSLNPSQSSSVSASISIDPQLPVITNTSLPDATINQSYSAQINVEAGNPPFSFSATGLPSGLSIDPSSGVISGTATVGGSFPVSITVTNNHVNGFTTSSVTWNTTLRVDVPLPVITVPPNPSCIVNQLCVVPISVIGVGPCVVAVSGLPPGLSYDPATGQISGTATTTGSFSVQITATCQYSSSTIGFTLNIVLPPEDNSSITLAGPAANPVTGQSATVTAKVTDLTSPAVVPPGTVSFEIVNKNNVTIYSCNGVALVNGQATCTLPNNAVLANGSLYSISATYSGAPDISGSTATPINLEVNPDYTSVVVKSSANPIAVSGRSVTWTATVSAKVPGGGIPTGSVTFKALDKNGKLVVLPSSCTNVALSLTGSAVCKISKGILKYANQPYKVTATYSNSDGDYQNSVSAVYSQKVY